MAKYLTWEKTRFRISHSFCYIPADDIFYLLNGRGVNVKVQYKGGIPYFENYAYHYICRPIALKDKNPIQFYTEYEFCKITNDIKNLSEKELKRLEELDVMYLFPGKVHKHPNHEHLYVQKRKSSVLPKFRTYDFLDTSDFNGCIFDTKIEHTDELEKHAKLIMLHFLSYRNLEELQKEGSYLKKFQHFWLRKRKKNSSRH